MESLGYDVWVRLKPESDREEGITISGEKSKSRSSITKNRVDALRGQEGKDQSLDFSLLILIIPCGIQANQKIPKSIRHEGVLRSCSSEGAHDPRCVADGAKEGRGKGCNKEVDAVAVGLVKNRLDLGVLKGRRAAARTERRE